MNTLIAPSVLAADFSRLGEELTMIEKAGADWVHLDVMDGHFVPNITLGPPVIKSLRDLCSLPFDAHLMIEKPENYIKSFAEAGANIITVHPETCYHLHKVLTSIHDLGIKAGVALNPSTPLSVIENVMDLVDLVLIMTVNPGFGGQKFIHSMIPKIEQANQMITQSRRKIYLQVDGGINIIKAELVTKAGANVLVAGSAIFCSKDPTETIKRLKKNTRSK